MIEELVWCCRRWFLFIWFLCLTCVWLSRVWSHWWWWWRWWFTTMYDISSMDIFFQTSVDVLWPHPGFASKTHSYLFLCVYPVFILTICKLTLLPLSIFHFRTDNWIRGTRYECTSHCKLPFVGLNHAIIWFIHYYYDHFVLLFIF